MIHTFYLRFVTNVSNTKKKNTLISKMNSEFCFSFFVNCFFTYLIGKLLLQSS